MTMYPFASVLLVVAAAIGWLNVRVLKWPPAVAFVALSLAIAASAYAARLMAPDLGALRWLEGMLQEFDFSRVLLDGVLGYLLFAGAYAVDWPRLRKRTGPVLMLATVATGLTTVVVGLGFWQVAAWAGAPVSLAWALVFGALISPTDPVTVLSLLKRTNVSDSIQAELEGESLFNDGVSIVLYAPLVGAAQGHEEITPSLLLHDLAIEAGGGLAIGLLFGFAAYRALQAIDDFGTEVLITIALATATYATAQAAGTSGPLAVVAAGLLVGERAPRDAMSDLTQRYVAGLWTLVDEILNALLFLLIGLEFLVLQHDRAAVVPSLVAIVLVLVARLCALTAPLVVAPFWSKLDVRNVPLLTWAGVKGGISIALALALPDSAARPTVVTATYAVVIFSIIVQGSTLSSVARLSARARPRT
jgi:CPA1 family monovalent cation:H+ antiporter